MESSNPITKGLYLGGIMAALNEKDLSDKGITDILSIDENPLPPVLTQRFNYKHVYALDIDDTDLLSHLAETFVFIEQARNVDGNVLVHCQAGMSRSATVVAAYLMQKMSIGRDAALELIRDSRPFIRPNDGFLEQLELFELMGCQIVKTNKVYRAYKLRKLADQFQHGHMSADCEVPSDLFIQSDFAIESNDAYYKCRKCRMILFRQGAVTNHSVGVGESAFDWRGKGPAKHSLGRMGDNQETCSRSLFVDPLQWMKGKINVMSGKLHCPKCDNKLGSFVWYGEKCPCGEWVAPAFHIDAGKVDKIPFQTVAPQQPRMGATGTASHFLSAVSRPASSAAALGDSEHFRRPLSQGPGLSATSAGGRLPMGKPVAMVAAVTPRMSSNDATDSGSSGSVSMATTTGMEIDELSLAVGTSSLENSTRSSSHFTDHDGGGGGGGGGRQEMDVDL